MYKQISSLQNPLVKQILQLTEKSRERKRAGLFVIEGQREILLALKGGYEINTLLFCSEIIGPNEFSEIQQELPESTEVVDLTTHLYGKLAYRSTSEGVLAIAEARDLELSQLKFGSKNPLILVAEAPEKPGNIGALLRTADAANLDAVILANPKTDLYNPNILRSSVGCVFTSRIAVGNSEEIIAYLKKKRIAIYCAALQASKPYDTCDFTKKCAIVVGTEDSGLSSEWLAKSTQNIIIPMQGEIDSMNVSVAAGILIFEAKRQRGFK